MWGACKVGARHWEENFLAVDWARRALVAFGTQDAGEAFLGAEDGAGSGGAALAHDGDDDDGDAVSAPREGRLVCGLVGLQVAAGDDDLREECQTVTCDDYHEVLVLRREGESESVCVLGVEAADVAAWEEWLRNAATVCTFEALCEQEGLNADLAASVSRPLREAARGGAFELELDGPDFFETPESTRAVALLLTANTAVLRCTDCVLEEQRASRLFEAMQRCQALRGAQFVSCGLGPLSTRHLCKALMSISVNLEELDLTENLLGDEGAAGIAETIVCLPRLRDLRLARNQISFVGGRALGSTLGRALNLRSLDISENPLGDFGVEALCKSLGGLPFFESMILHSCGATADATLQAVVQGLIDNRNASSVGGLNLLDLQDNLFAPAAIKRFLTQCSGLGSPQIIKLGRRQRERMLMAMDGDDEDLRRGQVVDLGFTPAGSPSAGSLRPRSSRVRPPRLEVVFGQEISPFRVLSAVSNLLGIYAGQARIEPHEGEPLRADNLQVATLEFLCDTLEHSRDCAEALLEHFQDGNSLLVLLHVVDVHRPKGDSEEKTDAGTTLAGHQDLPVEISKDKALTESSFDSQSPVSVVLRPSSTGKDASLTYSGPGSHSLQPEKSKLANGNSRSLVHVTRKTTRAEQEQSLLDAVRALLVIEDLGRNSDSVRAQLRTIAAKFARLDLFVPSERSEIKRFILEAKLARADPEEAVRPRSRLDSHISPVLAWALARLAQCTPSDALVLRAYVAALFGDVERCVAAAEQGKFTLGLMPSLSQLTSFESAALQAAAVAQDTETFSLILSQDLSEEEVSAGSIRLAGIVHNDLSARSAVLRPRRADLAQLKVYEEDPASFAGLVIELLRFERLNSRWSPRELRLQYSDSPRAYPITRPLSKTRRENQVFGRGVPDDHGTEDAYDAPSRFFKSAGEARVERAYSNGARRINALLLQASGDAKRASDDPKGYGAAHEAMGIAFASREIGLVDELVAQLICQTMCNPSLRSQDVYWKLLVLSLRVLEPSAEMCDVLLEVLEQRLHGDLDPHHMIRWATDALEERLSVSAADRKVRRLFASDASLRLDLLRQTLNDAESVDIDVHCWNGSGTKISVSPFTSFEDLLAEVDAVASRRLRRHPTRTSETSRHDTTLRWKDFCFTYTNAQGDTEVLSWQCDAYWWRWRLAVAEVLRHEDFSSSSSSSSSLAAHSPPSSPSGLLAAAVASATSVSQSPPGRSMGEMYPGGTIRIRLESYICAPSLWFYSSTDDLRAELLYWQRMSSLQRGEMCTSNPEALAYVASLAASVQISGGLDQWLDLDAPERAHVCLGHVPKAVRRRVGKRHTTPWMVRFQHAVDRFAAHVSQALAQAIVAGAEAPTQADLQRGLLAYTETWPLVNGLVFRDVKPVMLHRAGKAMSLEDFGETKHLRARFVLNARGLFLLALTKDAQTTRAIALLWWTPVDEIMRLQLHGTTGLHLSTRSMDQLECQMAAPQRLYKAIVSQCTTNLCGGNPHVDTVLQMVEFAHHFPILPWPPPPPPLYNERGDPVELDGSLDKLMDLSTTATVLHDRVLMPTSSHSSSSAAAVSAPRPPRP
ncbi:NACHT, LRR and PYD domains-containing protein 5 [Hondaea fermentalgiana]|uniref:NACHT, LRR and PYD domains-containing protein 5 n=1 Tax=Hondaea fermentalgiana TaxID=2315210 RepID=A0A2R5GDD6_9STRA|nr:NACHT, LRR and PYD domains-containing protein 5 [Hondaea fermentalgiana]|eukprot:GBG28966.1 NACHT, LRR and PYD domains-containing protein 5 [Hondaea fermentalgiana]